MNVETVRFYERKGLIPKPARRESFYGHGYPQYSPEAVARIRFIKRAQALGFALREISELLSLRLDPSTSCVDVKRRATRKVAEIQERIDALQKIQKALAELIASCRGRGPTGECPILKAFET